MQKDSFLPGHQPVVEFSKLDQNNKAEFLEFLIKNNITFNNSAGKDNLVAKITLKTLKPTNKTQTKASVHNQTKKITKPNEKPNDTNKKHLHADKENNQHYQQQNTRKPKEPSKSPLQIKTFTTPTNARNTKNTTSPSPFNKIKIHQKPHQNKSHAKKLNINDSTISLKSQRQNKQNSFNDSKIKQKTPERRIYGQTQISPLKTLVVVQEKSQSHRQSTQTPIKSDRSVSHKKESHQHLSNFKKTHKSTFTHEHTNTVKQKPSGQKSKEKSIPKVRDKVQAVKAQQNFMIKQRSLSMSSSNQQTLGYHNKNQSFEIQQRIQLASKYREYFSNFTSLSNQKSGNSSTLKQRPVCWPLNQVEKFLDEFYDDNFAKNTSKILNGSKKLNDSLSRGQLKTSHIVQSLQKHFNRKFNKVQKAIQYNLINLLYSIAFYINELHESRSKQQQSSYIGLKLFESFLTQKYELEDYLFFLFCRNILKHDFKKCFMPTVNKSAINKKQIDKFLKQIVGTHNQQVLEQYHRMIFKMIPTYEVEVSAFLKIILKDYKIKRQSNQQTHKDNLEHNHPLNQMQHHLNQIDLPHDQDSSLENTFNKILNFTHKPNDTCALFDNDGHIIREDSMEELTFGEQTKQILRDVELHDKDIGPNFLFWQSPYINKRNEHLQKERFLNDEFNQLVTQKLCQKTVELIEILSLNGTTKFKSHQLQPKDNLEDSEDSEEEDSEIQEVEELLFSKALCMFFTVVEMNKVKWLKELHINCPSQQDIEKVEQIQLFFRKIKENPNAKDIAEFCKLILTVSQITQELSKFFV